MRSDRTPIMNSGEQAQRFVNALGIGHLLVQSVHIHFEPREFLTGHITISLRQKDLVALLEAGLPENFLRENGADSGF